MSTIADQSIFSAGVLIRRILFFLFLISLSLLTLLGSFRGLSTAKGMEQAQIARELERGNGFTTKVIKPAALRMAKDATKTETALLLASSDTYHAPLHPVFLAAALKLVGGGEAEEWRMPEKESVYALDRIIAASSVICFLLAIGVNYLLISRIFDTKLAGVTAVLMLLCDLNWRFSESGLPQMFMLLLFSCACLFAYRAVEATAEHRVALAPALLAGFFFALLALTHWLAVWIVLGYALYAAFFLRPRGLVGLATLGFMLALSVWPILRNFQHTGTAAGTAFFALYEGLGMGEANVLRSYEGSESFLELRNLPLTILKNAFEQLNTLYVHLGSIVTAPLFFLALVHPFKRRSIASFRWCLLMMWVFATVGMALFAGGAEEVDANQLHILFAPLFAAYGLALVAILWSRLRFPAELPQLAQAHFVLVVLLSAGPLLISIPRRIQASLSEEAQFPHWPPYYPGALNTRLSKMVHDREIVVSDQPWAVAWYADRYSLWLPNKLDELEQLERIAADQGTPIAGILISPSSHGMQSMHGVFRDYQGFAPLVVDGWASQAIRRPPGVLALEDDEMKSLLARFPFQVRLLQNLLVYWSAEQVYDGL